MLLTKNTHNSGCKLIGSVFEDGVQLLLGIFAFMTLFRIVEFFGIFCCCC